MYISDVAIKILTMIQCHCNTHDCRKCKFCMETMNESCLLSYPHKWKLDELDKGLCQIPEFNFECDHWDLYDFFEREDEEEE